MKLVQEIAAISLGVGNTPIGILSEDYPTWGWYVDAIGKVKWLLSRNDLPGRMEGDPLKYDIDHPPVDLENVEVLLVQGNWSLINDQLWNMKSIQTILKFESGNLVSQIGSYQETKSSPEYSKRLDYWREEDQSPSERRSDE